MKYIDHRAGQPFFYLCLMMLAVKLCEAVNQISLYTKSLLSISVNDNEWTDITPSHIEVLAFLFIIKEKPFNYEAYNEFRSIENVQYFLSCPFQPITDARRFNSVHSLTKSDMTNLDIALNQRHSSVLLLQCAYQFGEISIQIIAVAELIDQFDATAFDLRWRFDLTLGPIPLLLEKPTTSWTTVNIPFDFSLHVMDEKAFYPFLKTACNLLPLVELSLKRYKLAPIYKPRA